MLLRLSPGATARVLRNLGYTPGRNVRLPYTVELFAGDYPSGTTITAVSLVGAPYFGAPPSFTKTITATLSASGQITSNTGTTGAGSFYFALTAAESNVVGRLGPLAFEVVVTDSLGRQATLDMGSLVPSPSTAGKPVDHVIVTPDPFTLAFPATQQLVATVYDEDDNILTGRVATWQSSDPAVATVSSSGLVSVLTAGSVVITATVEGVTDTAAGTTTVPPALSPRLRWAPKRRILDLAQPLVFMPAPLGVGSGGSARIPNLVGSPSPYANNRIVYPFRNNKWGQHGVVISAMADTWDPNVRYGTKTKLIDGGPYDNTTAWRVTSDYALYSIVSTNFVRFDPDAPHDQQDAATYRRGMGGEFKAGRPEDVGKSIRLMLVDNDLSNDDYPTMVANGAILKAQDFVLTADFAPLGVNFDNHAQYAAHPNWSMAYAILADNTSVTFAGYGSAINRHDTSESPARLYHPKAWHDQWGLLSDYQVANSWGPDCDAPTLYGGATSGVSGVAAPDSDDYYAGRTYTRYVIPNGGGFTTPAAVRIEEVQDIYPTNTPAKYAWLHIRFKPAPGQALPADGAFQGYIDMAAGPSYGPFNMVRDTTRHQCEFGSGIAEIDGTQFFRARVPINTLAEGILNGTPRIQNNSGAAITVDGYRLGLTAETTRSYGWHNCWVPKRTVTTRSVSNAAFNTVHAFDGTVTRREGYKIGRYWFPFDGNDVVDLYGNASEPSEYLAPEFGQSGPYGSADFTFHGALSRSTLLPGGTYFSFAMERGAPEPNASDYKSWTIGIHFPAGMCPFLGFQEFDVALAWKEVAGDVVLFVGFGTGVGSSTITWVPEGGTYCGGTLTVSRNYVGKLDWELGGNWDADSHYGMSADRDRIRQTGGGQPALILGDTVAQATVQASIDYEVATHLGPRENLRLAA